MSSGTKEVAFIAALKPTNMPTAASSKRKSTFRNSQTVFKSRSAVELTAELMKKMRKKTSTLAFSSFTSKLLHPVYHN